jgi:hypothetical protein
VVDRLLADLELLEEEAVLVIDDLHELDSADASAWLETFLARLPASFRVVLATREDPRLGLHMWSVVVSLPRSVADLLQLEPRRVYPALVARFTGRRPRGSRSRARCWRLSVRCRRRATHDAAG